MSRAQVSKHYARIISQWPVDRLRPEVTFQNLLRKRIEAAPPVADFSRNLAAEKPVDAPRVDVARETKQINALYSLLENRYSKEYPATPGLLKPASIPDHYTNLAREIEETPDRSWFGNLVKRMKGIVRFQ